MQLNLNDFDFKEIFAAAIVQSLDKEKRDIIIQNSITQLLSVPKDNSYYGKNQLTPLQEAFNQAMHIKAKQYVVEYLDTDPSVKERLQGLVKEAIETIWNKNRDKTVEKIANGIISGMYPERD